MKLKKNVEVTIRGYKFLSLLKNVCSKAMADDFVTVEEHISAFMLSVLISDALEIYEKEDPVNAKNDMPNLQ